MRDRDPISWSFPLPWRPLGVTVRVHVLFPCVVVGVVLGVLTGKQFAPDLWGQACAVLVLLFVSVLLHELAHVVSARRVGGDAPEVVLWPLGGLAFPDVPRSPANWFSVAVAGPLLSLFLAITAAVGLAAMGFLPPLNPLASPLNPRLHSWKTGIDHFSTANPGETEVWHYTDPKDPNASPKQVEIRFEQRLNGQVAIHDSTPVPVAALAGNVVALRDAPEVTLTRARLDPGARLLAQVFAVNWFLFLVNLLPAFPLDGGRFLQCFFWRKVDYRQATASAAYVGFLVMLLVGVYAIAVNELLPALVAAVIYVQCRRQLYSLEEAEEKPPAGYDFSQGYTSLERGEDDDGEAPPPPPPKLTWFQRWQQQRAQRRLERERAQRAADERRLDDLLDKILREGRQSLTAEEVRFLTQMSSRYPNRK